jgi:hypothetical protein
VAVAAIDAETGDVMLVAEGHRLRFANPGVGDIRRALDFERRPSQGSNHEDRAKDRGPGQRIRAAMKDLRHACVRVSDSASFGLQKRDATVSRSAGCKSKEKSPTETLAKAVRTKDYKYFVRTCRVF